MRKIRVIAILLLAVNAACAGPRAAAVKPHTAAINTKDAWFRVQLLNGSVLTGIMTEHPDVKIDTQYGTLTIPTGDIRLIVIGENNRPKRQHVCMTGREPRTYVQMTREGVINGMLLNKSFQIKMAYGEAAVPVSEIDRITAIDSVKPAAPRPQLPDLKITLSDGSTFIGRTDSVLTMDVLGTPLILAVNSIRSAACTKDETRLLLTNGDHLVGKIVTGKMNIKTLAGDLAVPLKDIASIGRNFDLHAGLVDLWSGEGNAWASCGKYGGSIQGTVKYVPGKVGQAFHFEPTMPGQIVFGDVAEMKLNDMTLSLWIRPASLSQRQCPLHKNYEADGSITIEMDGTLYYLFGPDVSGQTFGKVSTQSTGPLKEGEWTHVAVVRNSAEKLVTLYINGTAVDTSPYRGSVNASGSPLIIGNGYAGRFFGSVDEVAIWNRPLSAAEVDEVYGLQNSGTNF